MAQLTDILKQQEKAKKFHQLHHSGKLLILPNIWDTLGALLLESVGYPAIATASASIAFANGYDDGENISFDDMIALLKKIANSVDVPVTADIESGYAENDTQLKNNILQLLEAGVAGINIEDTDKKKNQLFSIDAQCERIKLIKSTSEEAGIPLFINARTDVYIRSNDFDNAESQLAEALKRGAAYKAAGAGCFFPLAMQRADHIKQAVDLLQIPVNILVIPGIPGLNVLEEYGVARISLGPSFLKIAIRAMKEMALQLKEHNGLSAITENEVTSDYLRSLVIKKYR